MSSVLGRPLFSVIVSTYQDDFRLRLCLESLKRQSFRDFEVLVVNDGSEIIGGLDSTALLVQEYQETCRARYFYLGPPSTDFRVARAHNVGLRAARGQYVFITNGDCVLPPGLLAAHVSQLGPMRVIAGLRKRIPQGLVPFLGSDDLDHLERLVLGQDRRVSDPHLSRLYGELNDSVPDRGWVVVWGCHLIAPLEHVRAIGGYDESFVGWGAEDEDLAERLGRGAGCTYLKRPDLWVYHLDHDECPRGQTHIANLERVRRNWTAIRNGGPLMAAGEPSAPESRDFSLYKEKGPLLGEPRERALPD